MFALTTEMAKPNGGDLSQALYPAEEKSTNIENGTVNERSESQRVTKEKFRDIAEPNGEQTEIFTAAEFCDMILALAKLDSL
jgi:hypothetical protein